MSISAVRKHIFRQVACLNKTYVIISITIIRKQITLTPTRAVWDMNISCLKAPYLSKHILCEGPGLYQVLLVQSLLTYWWKNFSYMLCGANTAYINYFSKIIITLREVNTGASSCVSEEKN